MKAPTGPRRIMRTVLSVVLAASLQPLYGCVSAFDRPATGQQAADLIISGGTILTLGEPATAGAIAVGNGRILALGDGATIEPLRGPGTIGYDLAGRVLAPAFIDHHVHLLNLGLALLYQVEPSPTFVDLGGLRSTAAIAEQVRARAAVLPSGTWILGQGWSQGAWGSGALPTHEILSAAAPNHPVFLTRIDAHAGWVNEEALRTAAIAAATPDPQGGTIRRMPDRSPSGVLLERANELLRPFVPEPSRAEVRRAFHLAAEALAARGVTEVFDAGFLGVPGIVDLSLDFERYLKLLVEADLESPLPLRIHLMVPAPSALAARIAAGPSPYRHLTPRIDVTHIKLFADGALGSRGAWLSHPYADDATTVGIERMSRRAIEREAVTALDAGLDVAVHAIGDAAVGRTLDVFEEILRERPRLSPERLRIEHFSYARPEDFGRAAALGIVLCVSPALLAPVNHSSPMAESRVGVENSDRVYALGRLAAAGARLAFGSDAYSVPGEALLDLYAVTAPSDPIRQPDNDWRRGKTLPRLESMRIQTRLWPAGGGAPERGGLAVGARADLVVLTADPSTVDVSAILEIGVVATFLDGAITHRGPAWLPVPSSQISAADSRPARFTGAP
jgi:predicted amidohydrolase YtcJ